MGKRRAAMQGPFGIAGPRKGCCGNGGRTLDLLSLADLSCSVLLAEDTYSPSRTFLILVTAPGVKLPTQITCIG